MIAGFVDVPSAAQPSVAIEPKLLRPHVVLEQPQWDGEQLLVEAGDQGRRWILGRWQA